MPEPLALSAAGLSLAAPDGRTILRDASLELPAGARAWIEGPPGSGKRALLKVLAGLLAPQAGEVRLGGVRLWPGDGAGQLRGRARLGFAFAQGGLLSNLSLRENLALPLRFAGRAPREVDAALEAALARFGLADQAELRPHALGPRSRRLAQWARLDLLDPEVIFLSEPFADLDGAALAQASEALARWAGDPSRLLLAAGDPAQAPRLPGARRLRLESGILHPTGSAP